MTSRLLLPVALLVTAGVTLVAASQTPPVAKPATAPKQAPMPTGPVTAEPPKKDFGVVRPEETVTAIFTLINPLDRDVTIIKSATSCQCTGVDVEGKVIPADGRLEMPASMKMSKAPIKKMASVTLVLDLGDGKKQPLRVDLLAEVAYAVRASPGFIDALTPAGMTGTFELVATDNKPFRVLSAHGKPPVFDGYDPASAPQTRYKIRYDLNGMTTVPKYFVLETDRADCPVIDLRVRHDTTHIKPPFKVAEFRSTFGRIAPGSPGSFELELEDVGTNQVTSVKSLSPDFTVTLGTQKNDGRNTLAHFDIKPASGVTGFRMFEVEIVLGGKTYNHLVLGSVR